ncbi:MAG: nuclear transport factor 2 family protein [Vicinamibacterales bacterium]
MFTSIETSWLTVSGLLAAPVAAVLGVASAQPPDDAAAIRAARAASNAAIAAHDVAGIARHWLPDVHIVTSTSTQGTGPEVNGQRMAQQFQRRPDTVYVRTPSTIDVFGAWNVASERGEWTGRWTEPDGVVDVGGTYLAQWRKVDGTWRIQAELFVPTRCRGSKYCAGHP